MPGNLQDYSLARDFYDVAHYVFIVMYKNDNKWYRCTVQQEDDTEQEEVKKQVLEQNKDIATIFSCGIEYMKGV